MRGIFLLLVVALSVGCQRFTVRTQNRVAFDGPVETRLDMTPVNPSAGPVRPVEVQGGPNPVRVAVVDVDGLLLNTPFVGPLSVGENPVGLFREKLQAAAKDPSVRAIVLRINSPGGGVAACMSMRGDLERFKTSSKIPVVACLLDVGTGGAYYLASAADRVVATPATVTGGIGVILNLYNLRDLMQMYNVVPQTVKSGDMIDIGTSARPLKPAEKELLQAMADEYHTELNAGIRRSRPGITDAGGKTFDGRIFTAKQALARGLVDQIGDLDEAIDLARQLGCPGTSAGSVVLYRRSNDPANSVYAVTANVPLQGAGLLPSLPGVDRSKLPTFLTLWQPEMTIEKLSGK